MTCSGKNARAVVVSYAACLLFMYPSSASAAACPSDIATQITQPSVTGDEIVHVACSGTIALPPGATVERRLYITGAAASGLTLNCNGAVFRTLPGADSIVVRSREYVDSNGVRRWERPDNVTVSNCNIEDGSVRVRGMASNGEGEYLQASSGSPNHVTTARAAAPTRITFINMNIQANGRIPLYIGPGSSYVTLTGSSITGSSDGPAVYFDAESYGNAIIDSDIDVSGPRELIAIDASSNNRIFGNFFKGLGQGGIFLYRNCGEGGTIRHTTPSYNQIINNIFFYTPGSGALPAVNIGSRNGNRNYCGDDAAAYPGSTLGSAGSNYDFATNNVVAQNQIYHLDPAQMIVRGRSTDEPMFTYQNVTVSSPTSRGTGCWIPEGFDPFAEHATSVETIVTWGTLVHGVLYSCEAGQLSVSNYHPVSTVPFGCTATGNNNGCSVLAYCPSSQLAIGATGACNLEAGTVTDTQYATVQKGTLAVTRTSDVLSDGVCRVGTTSIASGAPVARGNRTQAAVAHCRESDSNGGDCHIRGELYCY